MSFIFRGRWTNDRLGHYNHFLYSYNYTENFANIHYSETPKMKIVIKTC